MAYMFMYRQARANTNTNTGGGIVSSTLHRGRSWTVVVGWVDDTG